MANAVNFSTFGSVMAGVITYNKVAAISMREYTDQLTNMGISLAQYQNELPAILGIFGASMKARGASDRDLAQSALILTGQFDAMTKITGQTREQQAADLQKMTADAAFQLRLTEMSKEEQLQQVAALSEIKSTMGETSAEMYKMSVLGIVPLNKEMQMLMATVPGLNRQFSEMNSLAAKGKLTPEEMDRRVAEMVGSGLRAGKGLEQILKAAASGIGGTPETIAKIQSELMAQKEQFYVNGVFSQELFKENLDKVRKQAAEEDGIRKSLANFNSEMKILQDYFYSKILIPIMDNLQPIILKIVKKFESSKDSMTGIIDGIVDIVTWFAEAVLWIADNYEDIKNTFKTMAWLFEMIVNSIQGFYDAIKFFMPSSKTETSATIAGTKTTSTPTIASGLASLEKIKGTSATGEAQTNNKALNNNDTQSIIDKKMDEQNSILSQIRDAMQDTADNTRKGNRQFAAAQ